MLRITATLNLIPMELLHTEVGFWEPDVKYPEKRLWAAVIIQTIYEYKYWLHQIKLHAGGPVDCQFYNALQSIRYEVNHPWFKEVCEMNDVHWAGLIKGLKSLDDEYGLSKVHFTITPVKRNSKSIISTKFRATTYVN